MLVKDSFTSGMEATREKIVRVGGCWGLLGVSGVEEAEVEVSVADIARGGGDGGGEEERKGRWDFWRGGLDLQPFYQVEHWGAADPM